MKSVVVVSLSVGTVLLCLFGVGLLSMAIVMCGCCAAHKPSPSIEIFEPKSGPLGELHRQSIEAKYGPVNLDAAKEEKDGLLDRIRARRAARWCVPCQPLQVVQPQYVQTQYVSRPSYPQPAPIYTPMDPTDCNSGYCQPAPQTGSLEYPSSNIRPANCPDGRCPLQPSTGSLDPEIDALFGLSTNPAKSVKTGSFVCSRCRQPKVGDGWHTDWTDNGQPVTFLCESCYSAMSPAQRKTAFNSYVARQTKQSGVASLLFPEVQ